ncbi:MAG: HNH endonuclease signature motif containing protein [Verrucomicrobia bacterium]|nr:HNH endonuclease signature motif containing protein [Verrucomicrobiota bacterium]
MDIKRFLEQFQDYLVPKLDAYEAAIYLYIFRRTHLVGDPDITIGCRSVGKHLPLSIRAKGKRIGPTALSEKLESLKKKGYLEKKGERKGTRVCIKLPHEIPGLISKSEPPRTLSLEEMDFYEILENRLSIFQREGNRCFYCSAQLDDGNRVIDHVFRPKGDNHYRNVVAACVPCNSSKDKDAPDDFLRRLYRKGALNVAELELRLDALKQLAAGNLKPAVTQ